MKITLLGAGYVGLVTGTCLAQFGHQVVCLDTDAGKIRQLRQGRIPIYEPGLEEMLRAALSEGRLQFTENWEEAVPGAEAIFIAVGTPTSRRGNGYADLTYVHQAVRSLAAHLTGHAIIVSKSTVPVGTARQIQRIIAETNPKASFEVASNPEFLREGSAVADFMNPDRVVLGVSQPGSGKAESVLRAIYRPLETKTQLVVTSLETAELIKYAANAFLATKISFINEIANLCDAVGADVADLSKALGLDRRIAPDFLRPGPGFGGSCFPKDTVALIRTAQERGSPCRIIETVVEVNNAQKARMVSKIAAALGGRLEGKTLAVWGLSFKPNTDDLRDSPALTIIPSLVERGAKVRAHDPAALKEAHALLPEMECVTDPYEACRNADALCLMTEWDEYRKLDLVKVRSLLRQPVIVDLRNAFEPRSVTQLGFSYSGVGRGGDHGQG